MKQANQVYSSLVLGFDKAAAGGVMRISVRVMAEVAENANAPVKAAITAAEVWQNAIIGFDPAECNFIPSCITATFVPVACNLKRQK